MKLSAPGRQEIFTREGERLVVYPDSAGNPTVCNGHLITPSDHLKVGDAVSPALCADLGAHDLGASEAAVNRLVAVPLTQNQFDALVSLVFNIGIAAFAASTLLKLLNARDYDGAQRQFIEWHYETINGVKTPSNGLFNRRLGEAAQFGTPDAPAPVAIAPQPVTAADIPQAIAAPAPVAAVAQPAPPPTRVTQTRSGRALVGSAVTGGAGVVIGAAQAVKQGIDSVQPAIHGVQQFHALTAGLPAWLMLIVAPLAMAGVGFALYGIWHKQRSLQGAAP